MSGLLPQFAVSARLYFRNKMGMFYGYLFPAIFLLAFWMLYRTETVPLVRHMGQLLTVTILGGACLGMPTTMVSERERGVWRRYRLAPVSTRSLVASAVLLRYCILITAALLQLGLAIAIGMPWPRHPLQLWFAFTFVAFAFLGLGLVIAAMADNVPTVQALGQCIFLPMLIIGGVAVPLESLPNWARHVAAFFPGKYAVKTLQSGINGSGTESLGFDLLALLLIGVAGFLAGAWMFRWDAQQRFAARGKGGLIIVIAAWAAVGLVAESGGRVGIDQPAAPSKTEPTPIQPPTESKRPARVMTPEISHKSGAPAPSWRTVTIAEINKVDFGALPPDSGIVSPIARPGLDPPPEMADQLSALTAALPGWLPAHVADPVQRARNLLYVAAVPDILETEILESYVPLVVFEKLRQEIPKDDLVRILYWIAMHPDEGDDRAAGQLQSLELGDTPADRETVRERVTFYSLKLLGRMIGKIPEK